MSGQLVPLSPATAATGTDPVIFVISPNGLYAYAVNDGDATISQYARDPSTGLLTPLSPATVATGANPEFIAISPDGLYAYVSNNNDNTVSQYSISSGLLTPLSPATVATGNSPYVVAISPNGLYAYVVNGGSNTVSQYARDPSTGLLTPLSPATRATGSAPYLIAVSPDDLFAYVTNGGDNTVSQYNISQIHIGPIFPGDLIPLSTPTVATGGGPEYLAISSDGLFAYVVNNTDNTVSQYARDPSTGLLTPLSPATIAVGNGPAAMVISPSGLYVYVTNLSDGTISQFSRDPSTGLLAPLSPATVAAGTGPYGIAVSPDGLNAYAVNTSDNTVSQYSISSAPSTVIVPNVLGLQQSDAQAAIIAATLTVGATSTQPSLTAAPGTVLGQSPLGGATASPGDPVALIVSSGFVIVPNIVGDAASVANSTLLALGLSAGSISNTISADIPYGDVVSQSPAAGTHVVAGSFVSYIISVPGSGFNVDDTVISQYANSPTLLQLVHNMEAYIDPATNFANFYQFVWNVDTAVGFGLDIWGKIVGVSRLLKIVGPQDFVGFLNSDRPFDWQPLSQGTLYTGAANTQSYLLQDDAYRTLILSKALANIVATTAPAMNQLLRNLFPGRGNCFVVDLGGMAMQFVFQFALTPVEFAILTQSGALPHPAGVAVNVVVIPATEYTTFAEFGPTALPLSVGTLYLPP